MGGAVGAGAGRVAAVVCGLSVVSVVGLAQGEAECVEVPGMGRGGV